MGTAILACPGVSYNGMIDGKIGAGFNPPPSTPIPNPIPLESVPESTDDGAYHIFDLAILLEVL